MDNFIENGTFSATTKNLHNEGWTDKIPSWDITGKQVKVRMLDSSGSIAYFFVQIDKDRVFSA